MGSDTSITVRLHAERRRYELVDGEKVIGKAHWLPFEGRSGRERIFFHTTVNKDYSGQGLAGRLARYALDDTIGAGLAVVTVCPYFKAYVDKHQEYQSSRIGARPEHLAAVEQAAK